MDGDFLAEYIHGGHTARDYFDRFLSEPSFEGAFSGCTELRRRCAEHLWSAFSELEALPRTDLLWAGSNNRATFSKLRQFYGALSFEEPTLERCWRSFSIALCAGDLDLFRIVADVLLRTGELSMFDFICSSFNLQTVSGWETHEIAAELLRQAGMAEGAMARLGATIASRPAGEPEWTEKVLRLLEVVKG